MESAQQVAMTREKLFLSYVHKFKLYYFIGELFMHSVLKSPKNNKGVVKL